MQVIDNILYYIQQHFDRELSLEVLAREAHYSPYHFHRLFKQQVGEAPGQYLLRLRLEKATKELLFYPGKSVYAIAMDCGFSSQPVFSRAFKARYRLSAEQYREQALRAIRERTDAITPDVQQYPVTTARMERVSIACEITYLSAEADILPLFKKLHQWAAARELLGARPEYYGVFLDTPHTTAWDKCRYLAGIRIQQPFSGKASYSLGGATIARIPVMGGFDVTMDYALYVKQRWLPDSGYEMIQGTPGFEYFSEIDFNKPYSRHYRTICIGIQPK